MPTQAPPQAPEVPDVFGQALNPRLAQQGVQQQIEQAQSQGPQFSGYEGATGNIAGMLSKFIEGASVGRARADAKKATNDAMQQSQDANHLNQYIQMVSGSDKDPEIKQQLISEAIKAQGQMVTTTLEQAGKTNPLMKGLHEIAQTLMGGPPADVSTQKDPKTGKKTKVKTDYQGVDPDKLKTLWTQFASAPTQEQAATQKSQALVDQTKKVADNLATQLGRTPYQNELQAALISNNLMSTGEQFAKKYGATNPVAGYAETYKPELVGTQRLQDVDARQKEEFLKEQSGLQSGQPTTTSSPPSRDQFSLPTTGPASRQTQAEREVNTPITATEAGSKEPGWVNPGS